ncbi:MAG TPA: SpoIID/LytB domain-containing protein, partial [Firmicutes bacterium]|nr:SpoIID/LytB domain-containing protein [Bacillota bacterium]
CGGNTENSEDVWSAFVPYLRARECEFCRKTHPFRENKDLSVSEIERRLGVTLRTTRTVTRDVGGRAVRVITSQVSPRPIEVLASSPSGRIKSVRIGGKVLTALQMREALGLRSSKITWRLSGETLHISSVGYGHGVGLCQYGASGMASQGKDFVDILKYYYSGIDISALYAPSNSMAP